jgi:hypothetical protein
MSYEAIIDIFISHGMLLGLTVPFRHRLRLADPYKISCESQKEKVQRFPMITTSHDIGLLAKHSFQETRPGLGFPKMPYVTSPKVCTLGVGG